MNTERNINVSLSEIAEMEKKLNDDVIYPCTILQDRYGGTYSHARWIACNCDPADVPQSLGGSDHEEMEFWDVVLYDDEYMLETYNFGLGLGNTPNEAVLDLRRKIERDFKPEDDGTKLYEVWTEGYAATGEHSDATCRTIIKDTNTVYKTKAKSFIEACELVLGDSLDREQDGSLRLSQQYIRTQDGLTRVPMTWACRCFDNESRARKSFG